MFSSFPPFLLGPSISSSSDCETTGGLVRSMDSRLHSIDRLATTASCIITINSGTYFLTLITLEVNKWSRLCLIIYKTISRLCDGPELGWRL